MGGYLDQCVLRRTQGEGFGVRTGLVYSPFTSPYPSLPHLRFEGSDISSPPVESDRPLGRDEVSPDHRRFLEPPGSPQQEGPSLVPLRKQMGTSDQSLTGTGGGPDDRDEHSSGGHRGTWGP